MVEDIISNVLVLIEIGALGFTTFGALLAFLKPHASWRYRTVSGLSMLSFSAILLSMLIWPEFFASAAAFAGEHTGYIGKLPS